MKSYKPIVSTFDNEHLFEAYYKNMSSPIKSLDLYKEMLFEKYLIDNPNVYFSDRSIQTRRFNTYYKKILNGRDESAVGVWVYLPWLKLLVHSVNQEEYIQLRTARNRNLISNDDQIKLYNRTISVIGLSVGLNILTAMVRLGIGNKFIVADSDTVSISNFNRSMYSLANLGSPKSSVASESLLLIDPFLEIKALNEGLMDEHINDLLKQSAIVIDTFDSFDLKIKLRKAAKKLKVPIISCFDIDKGVLLIVERYDIESNLDLNYFLNGHSETEFYKKDISTKEKTNFFINVIGKEYHSSDMLESVSKVGTFLTGYPQLVISTSFAASLLTYAAHEIVLNESFASMRKFFSLSEMLGK